MELRILKDEEFNLFCGSEKVDNFVLWVGRVFDSDVNETIESILDDIILGGELEEAYGELCCEFDDDIAKAVELAKQQNISVHDALVATFGHFNFSYYIEDHNGTLEVRQKEKEIFSNTSKYEDAIFDWLESSAL